MNAAQCMAACLAWTHSRSAEYWLCLAFGVTGSVMSIFLRFGRRILVRILSTNAAAILTMPEVSAVNEFKNVIRAKHPSLKNVYYVADGLKVRLKMSGNFTTQNNYYNGWQHDHYVGNIFTFPLNGRIIACALNAPGFLHDSTVSTYGDVYEKLEEMYNRTGGTCVVDSAFCRSRYLFLIKSSAENDSDASTIEDLNMAREATALRQSAEWGMRALQGAFPRLSDRLEYEERGERRLILLSTTYLFNYRTAKVGLNEILSVYMPFLSTEAQELLPCLLYTSPSPRDA